MSVENLDDILNKIEAIFDCGAGSTNDLAKFMDRRRERINEYVRQRKHQPNVPDYIKMKEWASKMTLKIAMAGRKMQMAYKRAYQSICEKRVPVNGKD